MKRSFKKIKSWQICDNRAEKHSPCNEYKLGKYKIVLYPGVVSIIEKFIQNDPSKNESGGILLGSIIGDIVHVIKASTPNKFDKSSRYGFVRDKDGAQIIIDYEFENSQGAVFYVGEWHTHPEKTPTPSPQDNKMVVEQFHKSTLTKPFTIMLIRGTKDWFISLYDGIETYYAPQKV